MNNNLANMQLKINLNSYETGEISKVYFVALNISNKSIEEMTKDFWILYTRFYDLKSGSLSLLVKARTYWKKNINYIIIVLLLIYHQNHGINSDFENEDLDLET
ncbi:hypothetical protein C2G38_2217486 [Gigaspora rosea]|uniref:Uncharacterized protein n=1 Tax=Gigaspora rosea TaxID=44941 RepID=A0A397UB52_9GLOM|nr:hypothetical protein C2G38_2217486 [Gigaspora rosea]